jgi:N-succinyl-L-ornithine transcarbamylase
VSLESATRHPLQSLADLVTIEELKTKARPKVVLTWAPHVKALPQAVPNSFAEWMCKADVDFTIAQPEGYELSPDFTKGAAITHSQDEALKDADFIYVKNWSAYEPYGKVTSGHDDWMLTNEKLKITNNAKVMHCLPVRRNVELSDEILDGPNSVVVHEAGNRVWAAQAVLKRMLDNLG